jgi:hypothetical protein
MKVREIKFRAWHKSDEKMYRVYGFSNNQWFIKGKQFPMPPGAVHVMQYTGLHDKNGNEIFEGDIVKHEDFSIGCAIDLNVTGVVRMVDGAWLIGNEKNGEFLFTETGTNEVIGNFYDNPELVEDSDGGLLKCYESGTL